MGGVSKTRPGEEWGLKRVTLWESGASVRAAAHLVGYEKRIGRMNPEHLELLLSREMPFGKYKGRVIADLPGYYLAWLARKGFPPGQLGQLLALMHELDHNGLGGLLEPLRRARS
jgi:uncharacterized protein (DUF3820 family)